MGFRDWSTVAANNGTKPGINFAEGQTPASLNNSTRQMMADLAAEFANAYTVASRAAAIATTFVSPPAIITTYGYRTMLDGGGASYYKVNALAPGGFTTADGSFYRMLPYQILNPRMFGAYGDNGSHLITTPEVTANPQFVGVYDNTWEWDAVAAQECGYAALAGAASTPGNPVWNESHDQQSNSKIFVGKGFYRINKKLLYSGAGVNIEFETRLGTQFKSYVVDDYCLLLDTVSYGSITNLSIDAQVETNSALFGLDLVRSTAGAGSRLSTQQLTIKDACVTGNFKTKQCLIDVNAVAGGAGQGDTVLWENLYRSGSMRDGVRLYGQNTLSHIFHGGDSQHIMRNDIAVYGGSVFVDGLDTEPGISVFGLEHSFLVPVTKFTLGGGLLRVASGAGPSVVSDVRNVRNEGTVTCSDGFSYDIHNVRNAGADLRNSYLSFSNVPSWVFIPTTNNAKGRCFIVVDDGGPAFTTTDNYGYLTPDAATSTDTVLSFPGQAWTPHAYNTGAYVMRFAFGNGFIIRIPILDNTATTVTLASSVGTTPGATHLGRICQNSGAAELNWDVDVTAGYCAAPWRGAGNGITGTAGQKKIYCQNISPFPSVGDYFVQPDADTVTNAHSGTYVIDAIPAAFIAKITAVNAGTGEMTLDRNVKVAMADSLGYIGTPTVWGGEKVIDFDLDALVGVEDSSGYNFFPAGHIVSNGEVKAGASMANALRPTGQRNGIGYGRVYALGAPAQNTTYTLSPGVTPYDAAQDIRRAEIQFHTVVRTETLTCSSSDNGRELTLLVVSDGTSRVVTFGAGFVTTGTLTTPATINKAAVIKFVSNGTSFFETSRTAFM